MGFYAGKPIENAVYCFIQTYKCGKHSSLHNKFMLQFRKVDQTLTNTYWYGGFQYVFVGVRFWCKEKMMQWLKN